MRSLDQSKSKSKGGQGRPGNSGKVCERKTGIERENDRKDMN